PSRSRSGAYEVTSSTQRFTIASASSYAALHTRSDSRRTPYSLPSASRTSMSPSVYTAIRSPGSISAEAFAHVAANGPTIGPVGLSSLAVLSEHNSAGGRPALSHRTGRAPTDTPPPDP